MPHIVITNISDRNLHLRDLYITLEPNTSTSSIYRTYSDLSRMLGLLEYENDNLVTITRTPTEIEANSPFSAGISSFENIQLTTPNALITETIYVRTDGSDVIGLGTLAAPYATIQKALSMVPTLWNFKRYKIDITGMTIEMPETYVFPQFINNDAVGFRDNEFGFFFENSLEIYAEPTLLETVEIADILDTNIEDTVGFIEYEVDKSWTINEFKHLFATDSAGNSVPIISNGTNTILITTNYFTPPFKIYQYGAIIRNEIGVSNTVINLETNIGNLLFSGIKFLSTDESEGIVYCSTKAITFQNCMFSCSLSLSGYSTLWSCVLNGNSSFFYADKEGCNFGTTIFNKVYNFAPSAQTNNISIFSCYIDDCNAMPGYSGSSSARYFSAIYCYFNNTLNDAIALLGAGSADISNCLINSCGGNAVSASGNNCSISIATTTGSGNTSHGVQLYNGAQCVVANDVTVTGTSGDLKVGTLSVRTWSNFRGSAPVKNQVDFTALTGDGSRAYQD